MNSKIKVDPKTFKIINTERSINPKSESETFTSDSESETSLTSDNDSIKVIKLTGGENQTKQSQSQPQPQPQPQSQRNTQITEISSKNNLDGYLKSKPTKNNLDESSDENLIEETSSAKTNIETDIETDSEPETKPETKTNPEPDIIDLSQSKLYDILYSIFTDANGINISENIEKMSKLFDKHNQIMEKILNQLIMMNSNNKQIRIPEVVQTNTKIAKTNNDYRQNTNNNEQLNKN